MRSDYPVDKREFTRSRRSRTIRIGGWLLFASILLSACVQPLLNSERIEQQFGSYGVDVLKSTASRRITNLYSIKGERKTCRTLALVIFANPSHAAIATEHRQITAGGSIGAVFKENGWSIHKTNLHIGLVTVTAATSLAASLMNIQLPAQLAMHVYRFQLQRGPERIDYAIITELHHPDYLSVARLQSLYNEFPAEFLSEPSLAAINADARRTLLE